MPRPRKYATDTDRQRAYRERRRLREQGGFDPHLQPGGASPEQVSILRAASLLGDAVRMAAKKGVPPYGDLADLPLLGILHEVAGLVRVGYLRSPQGEAPPGADVGDDADTQRRD